jgi:hypothetical protein
MRRSLTTVLLLVATLAHAETPVRAAEPAVSDGQPKPIPWDEAAKHVGEEVTVEGIVQGIHCAPLSCLLAFEPTFKKFTAVIPGARFNVFPSSDELQESYVGRRVRVHGTVRMLDGKPEIPLQNPTDLALAGPTADERRRAREESEQNRSDLLVRQTEVLEQLADTLQGLQEVVDRLATAQERTEEVLARLDEQIGALAAAQNAMSTPSYEPPAPPAFEALRSVKRGMSQQDVTRLAGNPLQVERWDGGEIWGYGYGRTVTFNSRGRVEALVGFQ